MSTVWLFSGTREGLTATEKAMVRSTFTSNQRPDLAIHGDCQSGVDNWVGLCALWAAVNVLRMPAQWRNPDGSRDLSAGPKRNSEMVTVVSALVRCGWEARVFAFPRPDSRGTRDLIRKAEKAGLSVVVTELGGTNG